MTSQIDVPHLYRGKINLWVEDATSAAYFNAVWSDSDIRILTAGGQNAVEALAKHAMENRLGNVFGVVDADFLPTNEADWFVPGKTFRRFVLPVHEVENLMLDADAMAGCSLNNSGRSAADIEARMRGLAARLVSWMACRAVLAELRHLVLDEFPPHPKRDSVPDLAAAQTLIETCPWFTTIVGKVSQMSQAGHVQSRLQYYEQTFRTDLQGNHWKQSYSGKELFRDAISYFWHQAPGGQSQDEDAAKAIAAWQVRNRRIPGSVVDLRKALRQRVGI